MCAMFNFFRKKRTLGTIIDEYALRQIVKSGEIRDTTKKSKMTSLKMIKLVSPVTLPIENVKFSEIEDIKDRLLKTNSPATINRYLAILKQIFDWSYRMEYIERTPHIVRCKNYSTKEVDYLNRDQLDVTLKCIQEEINRAPYKAVGQLRTLWACRIMLYTGIRQRELRLINWNDIEFGEGYLRVPACAWNKGKERNLKLTKNAIETFKAMPKFHDTLIDPFATQSFRSLGNRIMWIKQKYSISFVVNPTIFRKTFCTYALAYNKLAIQEVCAYMGHSNLQTTAKYYTNNKAILSSDLDFIKTLSFNKGRPSKVA